MLEAGQMPEAISCTTGKPDTAGGPLESYAGRRKPVAAGSLTVRTWEARRGGRPEDENAVGHAEAVAYQSHLLQRREVRKAGDPMIHTLQHT